MLNSSLYDFKFGFKQFRVIQNRRMNEMGLYNLTSERYRYENTRLEWLALWFAWALNVRVALDSISDQGADHVSLNSRKLRCRITT
jgi:hypothetical protein